MNKSLVLSGWAFAFACGASAAEPQFAFPASSALEVVALAGTGDPKQWSIPPSNPQYAKMQEWLAHNQEGWSPYLATTPGHGILVSAGKLRIQFVGTSALACRDNAPCVHKRVTEAEYEFLIK